MVRFKRYIHNGSVTFLVSYLKLNDNAMATATLLCACLGYAGFNPFFDVFVLRLNRVVTFSGNHSP